MPRSESNTRPDNRSQKKQTKRNKKALARTPGKASFGGVGPGRMHNSGGVAAQATRTLLMRADKARAKQLIAERVRRKRKGK